MTLDRCDRINKDYRGLTKINQYYRGLTRINKDQRIITGINEDYGKLAKIQKCSARIRLTMINHLVNQPLSSCFDRFKMINKH